MEKSVTTPINHLPNRLITMPILNQIYVYPVKSLAGFQVQQWPVAKTGLRYDRQWMLVDQQGLFLSQRRLPKMALIKTRIADNQLWLSAAGKTEIGIALEPVGGEDIAVSIWDDQCLAKTVSDSVDAWLSDFLQHPCRLVYHPEDRVRKVDPDYATDQDQTAFSDGFPFLIVSDASLQAFNQAADLDLSMQRFRPNLVVSDCQAYAEDYWRNISINQINFRLPKPCSRCSVPAIDPDTAISSKAPLTALAQLRQANNKVYFGQNALHDHLGILTVGDEVVVNLSGESQPVLS